MKDNEKTEEEKSSPGGDLVASGAFIFASRSSTHWVMLEAVGGGAQ